MSEPVRIPLGVGAYKRTYAQGGELRMENRFFEENPTVGEGSSLLARPGSVLFSASGVSPYLGLFAQPGVLGGDLFVFSGGAGAERLHRYANGGLTTEISGATGVSERISFAASTGLYHENLFIASNAGLKFYEPLSYARGYVRVGDAGLVGQTLRVGETYYKWRGADALDTGDGTLANPYRIESDSTATATSGNEEGMEALRLAINYETKADGSRPYANTITQRNPLVRAEAYGTKGFEVGTRTSVSFTTPAPAGYLATAEKATAEEPTTDQYDVTFEVDINPAEMPMDPAADPRRVHFDIWVDTGSGPVWAGYHVLNLTEDVHYGPQSFSRTVTVDGVGVGHDFLVSINAPETTYNPARVSFTSGDVAWIAPSTPPVTAQRMWLPLAAREPGTAGNTVVLEVIAGDVVVGSGTTESTSDAIFLAGGRTHTLQDVEVPDDVPILKVVSLSGFVLAIEEDSQRFFFIRPGNTTIDPLDFESAESEPDNLVDAIRAGDLAWLFGESSVEAWYASGDAERPIQRMQGMSFRIGARAGTAALVREVPVFVGTDDAVYALEGRPQRISTHGIEERIRLNRESANNDVAAWSFHYDGHFFYVLTLETEGTFVYDASTQQWHHWYMWPLGVWNLVYGVQWGTRVVGISMDRGTFSELSSSYDMDPGDIPIRHTVSGFYPHRSRDAALNSYVRVYGTVTPSASAPVDEAVLDVSDDDGATWRSYTMTLVGSASQELYVQSLGRVGPSGRWFRLRDSGVLQRIDGLYAQLD